jgi:hypothetical protein
MSELTALAKTLQAAGTDCLVLDGDQCVHPPASLPVGTWLADVVDQVSGEGDVGRPVHVPRGEEWLRVECLVHTDGQWLVALLPRTRQHVVRHATRLQDRRDALQELAASTAREMNDAMTIVQGRLELLLAFGLSKPETALRHASIALQHSERITSALHNLRLVGSGGLLRFQGLDLAAEIQRAVEGAVDDPARVQVDLPALPLRVVGHEPAVQGVLTGVLRAVVSDEGGALRARQHGDEVQLTVTTHASRPTDLESLPLGIVEALLEALGGRLHCRTNEVVIVLPSELDERGLIPHGQVVQAIGQPAFTQAIRSFLEPDTPVRVARSVESADLDAPDLYAVATELLLPGRSGLAAVQQLRASRPEVRTLLVTHDPIVPMPPSIDVLSGPMDRVRLIRALTGSR